MFSLSETLSDALYKNGSDLPFHKWGFFISKKNSTSFSVFGSIKISVAFSSSKSFLASLSKSVFVRYGFSIRLSFPPIFAVTISLLLSSVLFSILVLMIHCAFTSHGTVLTINVIPCMGNRNVFPFPIIKLKRVCVFYFSFMKFPIRVNQTKSSVFGY